MAGRGAAVEEPAGADAGHDAVAESRVAPGDGEFVISLARGLAVIRAFSEDRPEQTLSELAAVTGLSRAVVRRFLHTLVALGYARTDGRVFSLTPRVLELGFAYLSSQPLPAVVQPHLEKLSRTLGESTSASVLDGADIVYVARVPTRRIMRTSISVGTRFPAYATSMGRVLLAGLTDAALADFLDGVHPEALTPSTRTDPEALRAEIVRVRAQGWCLVDQELEPGLRSVAAPITRRGEVVGAINVSTTSTASTLESIRTRFVPALLEAARAASVDVGITG